MVKTVAGGPVRDATRAAVQTACVSDDPAESMPSK
jgi:hypothetical protein